MTILVTVTDGTEKRICEVTNLFDSDGDETDDADLACKAVIKWDEHTWLAFAPGEPISHYVRRPS